MPFKPGKILGIMIKTLIHQTDQRGMLMELFRSDELPDRLHPAMSYISYTRPGIARGPHEHRYQTDIFCFIGPGEFKVMLWDNRLDSSTYQFYQIIDVGQTYPVQLIVPPGVVHGYRNISSVDGMVLNFPDRLYAGEEKQEKVDEIRHEDQQDIFYRHFQEVGE